MDVKRESALKLQVVDGRNESGAAAFLSFILQGMKNVSKTYFVWKYTLCEKKQKS